jgi:hypothetical protein
MTLSIFPCCYYVYCMFIFHIVNHCNCYAPCGSSSALLTLNNNKSLSINQIKNMKPSKMHFKIYEQGVHRTKDLIDILPYALHVTSMWCPNGGRGGKTM